MAAEVTAKVDDKTVKLEYFTADKLKTKFSEWPERLHNSIKTIANKKNGEAQLRVITHVIQRCSAAAPILITPAVTAANGDEKVKLSATKSSAAKVKPLTKTFDANSTGVETLRQVLAWIERNVIRTLTIAELNNLPECGLQIAIHLVLSALAKETNKVKHVLMEVAAEKSDGKKGFPDLVFKRVEPAGKEKHAEWLVVELKHVRPEWCAEVDRKKSITKSACKYQFAIEPWKEDFCINAETYNERFFARQLTIPQWEKGQKGDDLVQSAHDYIVEARRQACKYRALDKGIKGFPVEENSKKEVLRMAVLLINGRFVYTDAKKGYEFPVKNNDDDTDDD